MGIVKKYLNLAVSVNGAAPVTPSGPYTIGAGLGAVTNGIPVKGAIGIVIRVKATDSNSPTTPTIFVGNGPSRTSSFLTANAANGYGGAKGQAIRMDQPGGNTFSLWPADGRARFTHDFAQFSMTAHASGHTNFTIDAEVHYNEDPNSVMDEEGQLGLLPLTT